MMDRRTFVVAAGGALWTRVSPSDQLVAGLIGAGSEGKYLLKAFMRDPAVRIGAVCDVYEPHLEAGLALAGGKARAYRNYKAMLDDKNIQIIIIATPEHWHHRMTLDALAAGKDVYVEKPLCHTPEEGVELVNAAGKLKCVVQVGMQRRSYDLFLNATKVAAAGTLGSVRMVRSWWLNNQLQAPKKKLEGALDWEQWQGPAPRRALDAARFFDWRSYAEYSGGIMADQGAHVFDGIHMITGAGYPSAVTASQGRILKPGVNTPERVVVAAEYPEGLLAVFTINYAAMKYQHRNDQLSQFDGDLARLDIGRESFQVFKEGQEETPAMNETSASGFRRAAESHIDNFLQCVRTRAVPRAPMPVGFQAALVVQMANLSLRHGARVRWNQTAQKVEVQGAGEADGSRGS
jgi:predicted dehydrogenase